MKILIVGSTSCEGYQHTRKKYLAACRQLGAAVAEARHTLVLSCESANTVAHQILAGFASVEGRHEVLVYGRENGKTPFARQRKALTDRVRFTYQRSKGQGPAHRVHLLSAADAAIVIGGASGEAQIGYSAPVLERPVLAIPSFGGAAKELWTHLESDYQHLDAIADKVAMIRERWQGSCAKAAVEIVTQLVRKNPYKSAVPWPLLLLVALPLGATVAWFVLFLLQPFSVPTTVFTLLACSAVAGSGLRTTLRLKSAETESLSWLQLASEGVSGLVVVFGLVLVYLGGGFVVTGDAEFMNASQADYPRIAYAMSLLGLVSAIQLDKATKRLTSVLDQVLPDTRTA